MHRVNKFRNGMQIIFKVVLDKGETCDSLTNRLSRGPVK